MAFLFGAVYSSDVSSSSSSEDDLSGSSSSSDDVVLVLLEQAVKREEYVYKNMSMFKGFKVNFKIKAFIIRTLLIVRYYYFLSVLFFNSNLNPLSLHFF